MSVPPLTWQAIEPFLRQVCTPEEDPARFDELQRQAGKWFARGGSMRAFTDAARSGADTSVLTATEGRRVLERRYPVPL